MITQTLKYRHTVKRVKKKILLYVGVVGVAAILNSCLPNSDSGAGKLPNTPNIIYILADDLGYGDLGCYGQHLIETPNIDKLARKGMKFTQHYAGAPVCAPSRCVLMTGQHPGHAQIRGIDGWLERGDVWNYRAMIADSTLEGQRPMEQGTATIATLLKDGGYATGMVGKWGLGAPHTDSTPLKMGFDFFVGYNCQRQAHTYYPVHLYKNDVRLYLGNDTIAPGTKLEEGADSYELNSYQKYALNSNSNDVIFNEMVGFISDNNPKKTGKPFFLYWASPLPHMPLQAPQDWVDYYVGKFGDEAPYLGDKGYFPHRYPHAAYAAMVSYLDEQVGKLVKQLKEEGVYENTLIIVSSDNGPANDGGSDSPWFKSSSPFKSGYGWGKGFMHEGGLRVPMIASWPGHIKAGGQSDHISAFWDVLPTLCELAGVQVPDDADGISFLPELVGGNQLRHDFLYWEFPAYGGQQAVRMGKWKAIRRNLKKGNLRIKLYDLESDIQEQEDVAEEHPDILKSIDAIMKMEHQMPTMECFRMDILYDKEK